MFSVDHPNATGNQICEAAATENCSTPRSYDSPGQLMSLHSLSTPYSAGTRSNHPIIQPLAKLLAPSDARLTLQPRGISGTPSSSFFDPLFSSNILEFVNTGSAGHGSGSDNKTLLDRSYDVQCGLEQQPVARLEEARTSRYGMHPGGHLFGFNNSAYSQRNPNTSHTLADSRAGHVTSDNSTRSYVHSLEANRREQQQNTIHINDYDMGLMEQTLGTFPVWQHGHQLGACSAGDPTSASSSPPRQLSQTSTSNTPLTFATSTHSIDDSWKCDNCGRVLATKGTKNRNRNKRRHHCPGTGPKYPCAVCPRSFCRGDTRLLHLRKCHPEIHIEPPRPRARKNRQGKEG